MKITFSSRAWDDYVSWQTGDRKNLRRINRLIDDIVRRGGDDGIGQPERLRGDLSGWSSRRIDAEHRIVYRVTGETVEIIACRGHYE